MRNSENNPNSIFEKHYLSVSDIKSYLGISTSAAYTPLEVTSDAG